MDYHRIIISSMTKMPSNKIFIFVLCPPHQGSTIIIKLLDSSEHTTSFIGTAGNGEGQWLLKMHGDKHYEDSRWDPNYEMDMKIVKDCYDRYWDKTKNICIEKSPPTICRAKMFEEYFSKFGKVYFIISIRNPYSTRGKDSAGNWIKFARYQKQNIETLNNVIITNYEEICSNTDKVIAKIVRSIPELGSLKNIENKNVHIGASYKVNFSRNLPKSDRSKKISANTLDRLIGVKRKNILLKKNEDIMDYFGYKIIN